MFPINFVFWSCADRKVLNREMDRECLKESTCYFLFIGIRLYISHDVTSLSSLMILLRT